MKNKYIYIGIIIFIVAVLLGYIIYVNTNKNKEVNTNNSSNTVSNDIGYSVKNDIPITTTSEEEKTTPNTLLILKKVYKDCNHTIKEYVEIPADLVNLTKKEIENEYKDWKVEEFSKSEVILTKQIDASCNQHYVLRNENGKIAIYKINEFNNEELKEITDISTEYLTQSDLTKLEAGIKVYGEEELNSVIEDFE